MNKRSAVEGEKQGACSQERRTVCWAEPQREQDEREAEGRAGDKFTNTTAHPIFTVAFTLHQTLQKTT